MIAVDTNIIVRLLTKDDEEQFIKSHHLFKHNEIFISDTVILEVEWVLRYAYEFDNVRIKDGLAMLFGLENIHIANPNSIANALNWYAFGLDFADALHLSNTQHLEEMYTFDKKFIRKSKGLSSCVVKTP